jgi:hypothetical protein
MFKGKVLLFSLLLVFATTAYAGDVDECLSDWGWANINCTTPRIAICPQGDFEFIREGCGSDNDYIWVDVLDSSGNGIPGVPWSDYWLQACDPAEELCLCANPVVADSLTNSAGRTTFTGRIAGGGCVVVGGLYLAVQGKIIVTVESGCIDIKCVIIIIVSVDLTADCQVNLSDLGVFGLSYNKALGDPGYDTCCDYNDDDVCNLSDFAYMGAHYQHTCL